MNVLKAYTFQIYIFLKLKETFYNFRKTIWDHYGQYRQEESKVLMQTLLRDDCGWRLDIHLNSVLCHREPANSQCMEREQAD
jgi:hypothetical protein